MNELKTLRLSIARVAQALGVKSPLVSDGQGNPMPFEALNRSVESERGWNDLTAQCVEAIERLNAANKETLAGITELVTTLKGTFGCLEAWQCHLSDNARDKAAKSVGDVLEHSREVATLYS